MADLDTGPRGGPLPRQGSTGQDPEGRSAGAVSLGGGAGAGEADESARRLITLIGNLPGMVYRCECCRDWTMLMVSEGGEQLTGYSPEDLIGDRVIAYGQLIHPEDRDRVWEEVSEALAGDRPFEIEYRIQTRSGEERWVWERGVRVSEPSRTPILLEGFIADVTQRRRAQASLADHAAFQEALLDAVPAPVFYKDLDGRYLGFNRSFEEFFGTTRAEMVGRTVYDISPPELAEVYFRRDRELFAHPGTQVYEAKVQDAGGCTHEVIFHKSTFRDACGEVAGIIGVILDVTNLHRAQERLLRSQKMEAIGQLTGGIAHDFNNLITAINGYASFALEALPPGHPTREDVVAIQKSGNRAAALVRQLMAYSRKQLIEPVILDPNELVSGAMGLLRRTIEESIELRFLPANELWRVRADPAQLIQVLTNLAVNARDAMPRGGSLTVRTENALLDEREAAEEDVASLHCVAITVEDTGCGMDAATRAQIFEPFFTTKEVGKGTGLGLSSAYGIVKQHGGAIHVWSGPGEGTRFRLVLPRATGEEPEAAGEETPVETPGGTETILVVEDEEDVRRVTELLLKNLGYSVLTAASAETAIEVFQERGEEVDLLLTDVIMPGLHGSDLHELLVRRRPGLRVLYMSGYTGRTLAESGLGEAGAPLVQKPFGRSDLARLVRQALDA